MRLKHELRTVLNVEKNSTLHDPLLLHVGLVPAAALCDSARS